MRKSIVLVTVMSGLVILTACTTGLRYEATAGVAKVKTATRPVAVKSFEDRRPNVEAGSSKIGTAWGGSGAAKLFLPLFVPVSVEMPWQRQWTEAIAQSFAARGVQAAVVADRDTAAIPHDALIVTGIVEAFSVNAIPLKGADAHVKAVVRVYDAASKWLLTERSIEARHNQPVGLTPDIDAMNHAMRKAVDQLTSDPAVVSILVKK